MSVLSPGAIPTHADVIVIGGGIIGCSTAYHLARDHKLNVVLLEQNKLTSGSTWHAAGLVGQLRSSASITQVLKYSVGLYKDLEKETGLATGWKMTGCLRLATNQDRWIEFKRLATTAQSFGMEMHLLSPTETKLMWPLMNVDDLVGSTFLPTDGQASPTDITHALAKGARMHGAKLIEGVRIESFDIKDGRLKGLRTSAGHIATEKAVICAGMWSRQLGAMAGVNIPIQPVKHQYVITEKLEGLSTDAPSIRDPDRRTYFKEEVGGLSFGGYEPNPQAWDAVVPPNFEFQLFDDDYAHFEQHLAQAAVRVPSLNSVGIKQMINGPESFTPDGNFILGAAPEVKGIYVGCGFNAFGIASGGGAGWVLADWVTHDEPPMDLWPVDLRRFSAVHEDQSFVRERTLEAYGKHYTIAFPHEEYVSARSRLKSPLYDALKREGAVFGSKLGWERANWFSPDGATDRYAMGRQNWFDQVGAEHRLVREKAGVFDQSSFAKFEMKGPDALSALELICANNIAKPAGRLTYTQMLNTRGGIECDLTVARLADDHFYLVTGTGFRAHDFHWIREHIPAGARVTLRDVTEEFGTLVLMGPAARVVLQPISDVALDQTAFPFGHCRVGQVAGVAARLLRVTYVGELGWEIHAPMGDLKTIYDALMASGAPHGLRPVGYRALESLRLEKGYRAWAADITPNDTPLEAGLGWAVKFGSNVDFIGRAALVKRRSEPLKKMLVTFTTERNDIVLVGRETILRDGAFAGYLTSGGYGYSIGKPIGLGYVRYAQGVTEDYVRAGSYELVVAQERVVAKVHLEPTYDAKGTKPRQ
jgi:sarcosine dehydrogenase